MSKVNWPKVTLNGKPLPTVGDSSGVVVTPEFLMDWMASTTRPNGYEEGDVYIELDYREIARLFGEVTVEYSEDVE